MHKLFFFLDDFHRGSVNHILHFAGFFLMGYGLGKGSLITFLLAPVLMEIGHVYNYSKGIHKEHALRIIPLQLLGWFTFAILGYLLTKII